MLRAEFVTSKSEASRSFGNVMSKWPDDAMKNIAQLSLGIIKKGKQSKNIGLVLEIVFVVSVFLPAGRFLCRGFRISVKTIGILA